MQLKDQSLLRATLLEARVVISECRVAQSEAKLAQVQALMAQSRADRSWRWAEYILSQIANRRNTRT